MADLLRPHKPVERELLDEIERLRASFEPGVAHDIISRQSHEIERLRAELARLNSYFKATNDAADKEAEEFETEIERLREHLQDQYRMGHHDGYHDALKEAAQVAADHAGVSSTAAAAIRALKHDERRS